MRLLLRGLSTMIRGSHLTEVIVRTLPLLFLLSCGTSNKAIDSGAIAADTPPTPTDTSTPDTDSPDTGTSDPDAADADGDGFDDTVDCDDQDPEVNPDAEEICDGIDNDCDGDTDDDDDDIDASTQATWYADADDDGFGNETYSITACEAPETYVAVNPSGFDCDDTDPLVHPTAAETDCADPKDYNCDGSVGYRDADGDGFAACEDCNDLDPEVHPDAVEVCDHIDNDCDTFADDDDHGLDATTRSTFYADEDGDGFGNEDMVVERCFEFEGAVTAEFGFDCDDDDEDINPLADEVCDEVDNDCDGDIDDDDEDRISGTVFYIDHDRDGHGSLDYLTTACAAPEGYTTTSDDCDDLRSDVYPGADERCDGIDNNCDDAIDGLDAVDMPLWYRDNDGDGHGTSDIATASCMPVGGYSASGGDCDDDAPAVFPGAEEVCDGIDNDCNDLIDDGEAAGMTTWYRDEDGDGHGLASSAVEACEAIDGYVEVMGDCDDDRSDTFPGAPELCDAVDNDCDGSLDDGLSLTTHYRDMDSDGFGTDEETITACASPEGFSDTDGDCHDGSAVSYPGATEDCFDTLDNDCDGQADCDDLDSCKATEAACWVCGDGIKDPDEDCDDGGTVSGDGCSEDCTSEIDLSGLHTSWTNDGRQVYVFKSVSSAPLSTYDTFCEDKGLAWYVPTSSSDADKTIRDIYELDSWHTWIITKNNTTTSPQTWGGYPVYVCSGSTSSSGFSGIRQWSSCMCDPDSHGHTRCWDSDHSYDWLVCMDA